MMHQNNTEGKYQCEDYCPWCGEEHEVKPTDTINWRICEAKTYCWKCGWSDYWAYGFFESIEDIGYGKSRRY